MTVTVVNPRTTEPLRQEGDFLVDAQGERFPISHGIPRFTGSNYSDSFGFQWQKFRKTQLDSGGLHSSHTRFFAETGWDAQQLAGLDILEVGSGAGRFSRVVLEHTDANLWSVDYSEAVNANFDSNSSVAPHRFHLFQASIYDLPFPDSSFDKVFCLGVLQHTPDFFESVRCLVKKAKVGGEVVVDFYPINGWWTKVHAKYLLRPITKRVPPESLLRAIDANVDWLIRCYDACHRAGLGRLTRFLPLADMGNFPPALTPAERREWAVLDTFDAYSPEHDHPQRIHDVVRMFERSGARITFAGKLTYANEVATVIRAVRE